LPIDTLQLTGFGRWHVVPKMFSFFKAELGVYYIRERFEKRFRGI
jgi:hypothetical protein